MERLWGKRVVVALILPVLTCLVVAFFSLYRTRHALPPQPDFSKEIRVSTTTSYFKDLIRLEGPAEAHDMYVTQAAPLSSAKSHLLAHIFGSALFETLGTSSIAYCGGEFSYGCYHQFLGESVAMQGLGAIGSLFTYCEQGNNPYIFRNCEHGIGHGVLDRFGYTLLDLQQALATCDRYNQPYAAQHDDACADGVLMEYNLRLFIEADDTRQPARILTEANKYEPCYSIDAKFRKLCAYELPLWWGSVMAASSSEAFWTRMGGYCAGLAPEMRLYCFEGAGYMASALSKQDIENITRNCSFVGENTDRTACFQGAVRRHLIEGSTNVPGLCASFGLTGSDLETCSRYTLTDI